MQFNINGFWKLFILCFVMALGFFLIYGVILGVPTTKGATVVLILLSVLSVFLYFWVCVEEENEKPL